MRKTVIVFILAFCLMSPCNVIRGWDLPTASSVFAENNQQDGIQVTEQELKLAEQTAKSWRSAYAKTQAFIALADQCRRMGRNSKSGSLLNEANRMANRIPADQDALKGYLQWVFEESQFIQYTEDESTEDQQTRDGADEDNMDENLPLVQNSTWTRIAEEYVEAGYYQKAIHVIRQLDVSERDESWLEIGEKFVAADRMDFAIQVAEELKDPEKKLSMWNEIVHWRIQKGDLKSARQNIAKMIPLMNLITDQNGKNLWLIETAKNYLGLQEYVEAEKWVVLADAGMKRIEGKLLFAEAKAKPGQYDEASGWLIKAFSETLALDKESDFNEALTAIISQIHESLPKERAISLIQTVLPQSINLQNHERKLVLCQVLAGELHSLGVDDGALIALDNAWMAVKSIPDSEEKVKWLKTMAERYLDLGKPTQADQIWTQTVTVIARMKADAEYKAVNFASLVGRMAESGNLTKALEHIKNKQSNYDKSLALAEVARCFLVKGDLKKALWLVEMIPNAYRRSVVLADVAAKFREAGDRLMTLELLDKAYQGVKGTDNPTLKARLQRQIAFEYGQMEQYEIEELVVQTIQDETIRGQAALELSENFLVLHRIDESIRVLNAYAVGTDRLTNYLDLAAKCYELKLNVEKDQLLGQAVSLAKNESDANVKDEKLFQIIQFYTAHNELETASEYAGELTDEALQKESVRAIVVTYFKTGRYQEASEFGRAKGIQTLVELSQIHLAKQHAVCGQFPEALQIIDTLHDELIKGEALKYILEKNTEDEEDSLCLDFLSETAKW